jgi:tRNA 2-thiouridine synthesizing protein A
MSTAVAQELDFRGLACPLPIVKTARVMKELSPSELVEVLSTDPASVPFFDTWCRSSRNELVATSLSGGVYRFVIRKGDETETTPAPVAG